MDPMLQRSFATEAGSHGDGALAVATIVRQTHPVPATGAVHVRVFGQAAEVWQGNSEAPAILLLTRRSGSWLVVGRVIAPPPYITGSPS